ncbi:hypothetical protein B0H10DRAFT_2226815 [Mycena sp. CBHHK59/15]|nr:hypothetical protein B0H10DRAFT_2226815 [Mycena sp. CBHHK59/15]
MDPFIGDMMNILMLPTQNKIEERKLGTCDEMPPANGSQEEEKHTKDPSNPSLEADTLWSAGQLKSDPASLPGLRADTWSMTLTHQDRKTDLVELNSGVPFIRDRLPHLDAGTRRRSTRWIENNMPRHLKCDKSEPYGDNHANAAEESMLSAIEAIVPSAGRRK